MHSISVCVARPLIWILDWMSIQLFWEEITLYSSSKNWLSSSRVLFLAKCTYSAKLIILVGVVFVPALDGLALFILGLTVFNSAVFL